MASPATYNLVVPQSTTFVFQFQILEDSTPWNLTNYGVTMTVRPFPGATSTTLVATKANGKITVDAPNGRITVTLSAVDTSMRAEPYAYDIVLNSGSAITRILEGQFIVTAGVTV